MEIVQKLERQHEKLVHFSETLENLLATSHQGRQALAEAHNVFSKLLKLTGKHLSQVDQVLYPQILEIHNRKLRKNLGRILTRTGHVRTEVLFLAKTWTLKLARKKPAVFQSVAWHFLAILSMRLVGERKIYAILNRCDIPMPPPVAAPLAPADCS